MSHFGSSLIADWPLNPTILAPQNPSGAKSVGTDMEAVKELGTCDLYPQNYRFSFLDPLFSGLSCVVSVPFYTGFLPLLFWSGHGKLARQMTLLIAFSDYTGNYIKDVVSALRPPSPPVHRITATKDEEDNALEYGLPSSHTLNTVCLSGYLLHYVLYHTKIDGVHATYIGVPLVVLVVTLIGFARVYLGMHSVIDIIAGLLFGLGILAFWLSVDEYIDNFVVSASLDKTDFGIYFLTKLLRRHWNITDAHGKSENVWGFGVVREEPAILPKSSFEYSWIFIKYTK
ncbi:lipid phosphate phosphatase delta-like [Arachis stenosperma]|uniref:lipid phosphate phosphatase delta-like n=1 Tax=Arachis stenosperma TaxID=217475 RepID=UPI0025AD7788|nr:lipid phosphate phosphatase delta-like [Arachis stenosperma]